MEKGRCRIDGRELEKTNAIIITLRFHTHTIKQQKKIHQTAQIELFSYRFAENKLMM